MESIALMVGVQIAAGFVNRAAKNAGRKKLPGVVVAGASTGTRTPAQYGRYRAQAVLHSHFLRLK